MYTPGNEITIKSLKCAQNTGHYPCSSVTLQYHPGKLKVQSPSCTTSQKKQRTFQLCPLFIFVNCILGLNCWQVFPGS